MYFIRHRDLGDYNGNLQHIIDYRQSCKIYFNNNNSYCFFYLNSSKQSQLLKTPGFSENMSPPIGVYCNAEGNGEGRRWGREKWEKYLDFQI